MARGTALVWPVSCSSDMHMHIEVYVEVQVVCACDLSRLGCFQDPLSLLPPSSQWRAPVQYHDPSTRSAVQDQLSSSASCITTTRSIRQANQKPYTRYSPISSCVKQGSLGSATTCGSRSCSLRRKPCTVLLLGLLMTSVRRTDPPEAGRTPVAYHCARPVTTFQVDSAAVLVIPTPSAARAKPVDMGMLHDALHGVELSSTALQLLSDRYAYDIRAILPSRLLQVVYMYCTCICRRWRYSIM